MKTLLATLALMISAGLSAAVITVDNNSGASADYSSLSAAIGAANAGDTILIHASPNSYGSVTLSKKLVLIGTGHRAAAYNSVAATLANLTINAGSDSSVIQGLNISYMLINSVDAGIIRECRLTSSGFSCLQVDGDSDDWLVEGCVFDKAHNNYWIVRYALTSCEGWIYRNNYFGMNAHTTNNGYVFEHLRNAMLKNNLFTNSTAGAFFDDCSTLTVENNIFFRENGTSVSSGAGTSIFNNNLTYSASATLQTLGGTNFDNIDPEFESVSSPQWNYNANYQLKGTSIGVNAGTDGTDLGIYGGNYDFRMGGEPVAYPRMIQVAVKQLSVPQGNNLDVEIKARRTGL